MNGLMLNLLNVFPVTTREHTPQELAFAEAGIEPLRERITYQDEAEMVKAVIDEEGVGQASSAMSEALQKSSVYRSWQHAMPYLKEVKNIHSYRVNKKHRHSINDVHTEILCNGGYLEEGQILFRGGNFSEESFEVTNGPISTSTMPSVARWHGIEVHGEIAILKISESNSVKAFAFKTKGNQKHTQEFEVLLQNNLKLEFQHSFTHKGMKVLSYDVCRAVGPISVSIIGRMF